MNFQKLEMEILRGIRGSLSQQQLSTQLGFGFNQVYRWERGLLNIRWKDFVVLCQKTEVDLHSKMKIFFGELVNLKPPTVVATLKGIHSLDVLTKQMGRQQRVIQRWLSGSSEPYLKDILKLIYVTSHSLLEFSAQLAGKRGLPTFTKELNQRKLERDFHFSHPEFAAIIHPHLVLKNHKEESSESPAALAQQPTDKARSK